MYDFLYKLKAPLKNQQGEIKIVIDSKK